MTDISSLSKHKKWILLISACIICFVIIGFILFPTIFYDQFIWKYFWGPIVSDGLDQPMVYNGIAAEKKFTLVSEIVYGLMVISALFALLKILKKWKISIDTSFFIALLPLIFYGTIVRVLEDAKFFQEPFVFWFVTPLVYFQVLLWFLLFLFIGIYLERKKIHQKITTKKVILFSGTILLIPFLYYTIAWMAGYQWAGTSGVRYDVFYLVSILLLIILLPIFFIAKRFPEKQNIFVYSNFMNLSLILGHMIDGVTTWISIYDPFQMGLPAYIEKHPASDLVMQIWPPLFPIIKLILILLVIYVFDVLYKEDLKEYPQLAFLLKIGIFILGFAPGLRDLLRVSMGV